jgi:hypothetical protein
VVSKRVVTYAGTQYEIFTKHYCDENNIYYLSHWQDKVDLKPGTYILTDDLFVIPVITSNISVVIFPNFCHKRRYLYCLYSNRDGSINKNPVLTRRAKRTNIEDLIALGYQTTLSISGAVKYVFGDYYEKWGKKLINQLYQSERMRRFLMSDISDLFKRANVDAAESIKRMDTNAQLLEEFIALAISKPDVKVEEVLKAIAASHTLNKDIVAFSSHGTEREESSGYFLTAPVASNQ